MSDRRIHPSPPDPLGSPRRKPVERFLGPDEARGGPFALLCLSPSACTDDLVLCALDRQIERIARHPECDTPEADEVRLALHAAAAQLLDHAVRRHLIARWGDADAPQPLDDPRPLQDDKILEHDAILALGLFGGWNQQSLRRLLSIAHARGFSNTDVARTLRALAATRRPEPPSPIVGRITRSPTPRSPHHARPATPPTPAPTADIRLPPTSPSTSTSSNLSAPGIKPSPRPAAPASSPPSARNAHQRDEHTPLDEQVDPLRHLFIRSAIITGVAAIAIAAASAIVLWVIATPAPSLPPVAVEPESAEPAARTAAATPQITPADPSPTAPKPPPARLDPRTLPQEIAASAEALDLDADAATERLANAINLLAAEWTGLSSDLRIACHDGIVEFIYLAGGRHDVLSATIEAIAAGAAALADDRANARTADTLQHQQILPAIWSVGMLSRLTRERDLPLTIRLAVESRLIAAFGAASPALDQTFHAGAMAALLRMPQRLTPRLTRTDDSPDPATPTVNVDAWRSWADAVDAFSAADRQLRNRILLVGLETLLVKGPGTTRSRTAAEVVTDLVVRLDWRDGDEARRWLVRCFSDRLISTTDLHALTSALATRSSAEGVDLTMVLSTSASDRVRADLRERYAEAWNLADLVSREEITLEWTNRARELLDQPFAPETEAHQLGRAALFVRLNEAAHWQWRGEQGETASIMANLTGPIEAALAASRTAPDRSIQRSADWAERYLAARQNIRARRDLLHELSRMHGVLGDVDAAVLVQEAVMGSPPEVRLQAIDTVKRFAINPAVLSALLDRLPRMPRLPSNSDLVQSIAARQLPSIRDESWPIEARRALLHRLLEAISTVGPQARLDAIAAILASSYHAMGSPLPLSGSSSRSSPDAHTAAHQVWTTWRAAAEPLIPSVSPAFSLSQIERRRTGRLAHARGPIQLFAAEQASIYEIMAYTITCERPGRADAIRRITRDLAAERRAANHIFDQMIAVERAMVRLWLIRLEAEEPT